MKTLLLALALTSILHVTPSTAQEKDYCLGFPTCTFDDQGIYFDLSSNLWLRTNAVSVRKAAEAYCVDHPGSKVYVDLGDSGMIEGTCGATN